MSVAPINVDAISWCLAALNNHLSTKGWIVGVKVNKNNEIIDANLVPVGDAIAMGYEPVQKEVTK
jgi:hypothetical protein